MKSIGKWNLAILFVAVALPGLAQDSAGEGDDGRWTYDRGLRFQSGNGAFRLGIDGFLQARVADKDPELGERGTSFSAERAKIRLVADAYGDWEVTFQANLAEGSEAENDLLEDAFVRYKKHGLAQLWLGQGKVQFGRQALTSSANLQFVDRSIATTEFLPSGERNDNRDVGIALMGVNPTKTYAYSLGIYNGNGINKDEKDNTDYMGVARLVTMPFGEYPLTEVSANRPDKPRLAIGVSAVSLTRGTGVLDEEKIRDTTAALEFGFAYAGLNMSGEYFTRSRTQPSSMPGDEVESDGWYFQGGYLFKNNLEVALRYAEILREVIDNDETEAGIAVNYYVSKHGLKIQTDYRQLEFEAYRVALASGLNPPTGKINTDVFRFQLQIGF